MKSNLKFLTCFISLFILFSSCGRFGNKEDENRTEKDRIVCVSKQLTELIYALGAGNKIVAVDLSSTYPEAVKKLPTVGYHRMLSRRNYSHETHCCFL